MADSANGIGSPSRVNPSFLRQGFFFLRVIWMAGLLAMTDAIAHCPNDVSPSTASFSAAGGTGSFEIITDPGCPWIVLSSATWLKVTTSPSGFGAAKVSFSVERNSAAEKRVGTLNVTGNLLTVLQAGTAAAVSDLALNKSHTGNFTVGTIGSYTLTATSVGSAPAVGTIRIADTLPPGLTFVSAKGAGWSCVSSGATVTCTRAGSLAPQEFSSVVIDVSVSESAAPSALNTATLSNDGDTFADNNVAADPTLVWSGEVLSLQSRQTIAGVVNPDPQGIFPCAFSRSQYRIDVPSDALQLIVTLRGSPSAQLLVSSERPLALTPSPVAEFALKSVAVPKSIYVGAQSNPLLRPGAYYITVANCDSAPSSFELTATVITRSSILKQEELAIDDGTPESGLAGSKLVVVNRLRPSSYPSKLKAVRLYFTRLELQTDPLGKDIRLFVFADPFGSGAPPVSPLRLVDQTVTVTGRDEYIEFPVENGPTIYSGDWYVGFQNAPEATEFIVISDTRGPQRQSSFYSSDGGVNFIGPAFDPSIPMNFMIRAVVENGPEKPRRRP